MNFCVTYLLLLGLITLAHRTVVLLLLLLDGLLQLTHILDLLLHLAELRNRFHLFLRELRALVTLVLDHHKLSLKYHFVSMLCKIL